ncbi:MAG: 4'-phosphopantetheinyl transferase superfamily protein [Ruminococcaceae bacterium]|nr:4'-phosphopantetheinyl transferase superfamily protein [Oscillospiraceae bacterium]
MIRILCADISSADGRTYGRLYESASDERKRKADRYRRYEDQLRCVTADALLKIALNTDDFQIEKNKYGKPYIKNREGFYYNLSHSGQYVALAFGNTEVGIDIQKHDTATNMRMIADICFARDEKEYVWQNGKRTVERFYEIWTGKESYLKYVGKGLSGDMRSFSVFGQGSKIRCLQNTPDDGYTLSFCSADKEYTLELSDIRQLG